ncbi:hypothetical protein TrRE_jg13 [Triparma retinervis]|uniref:Fe2OG dioxygenase domain-containing protein n=1 Tax=Triparma retinervis TaxID=2557542 RepID=A0A9W6ZIR8_9STRA|nr:hypothetical protein TrRE_jg13 [Triparma retinervis]
MASVWRQYGVSMGTKSSSNRVHSNSSPKEVPKPSRRASFLSRFPGIRFTRTPPLESRPCSLQRDVVDAKPPRRGVEGDARSTESSIYRLNDQGLEWGEREGEGTFKKLDFEGEAFTSDGSLVGGDVCGSVVDEVLSLSESIGFGSYVFAKQTLSINDHPTLSALVSPITASIVSSVNALYSGSFEYTKSSEPHVVVYDASVPDVEGYRRVAFHTDASDVTFIVALSSNGGDYEGGGTVIESYGPEPISLEQGECLLFEGGKESHKGEEITRGVRVLLVGFMKRVKGGKGKKVRKSIGGAFLA